MKIKVPAARGDGRTANARRTNGGQILFAGLPTKISPPRAHTASHRTHETKTKKFPGSGSSNDGNTPQPPTDKTGQRPIRRLGVGKPSSGSILSIGTPSGYHRGTIGTPSVHHRNTIGTPSRHNRNTIGTPSGHHRNTNRTPSGRHRNTSGTPSGHHRDT